MKYSKAVFSLSLSLSFLLSVAKIRCYAQQNVWKENEMSINVIYCFLSIYFSKNQNEAVLFLFCSFKAKTRKKRKKQDVDRSEAKEKVKQKRQHRVCLDCEREARKQKENPLERLPQTHHIHIYGCIEAWKKNAFSILREHFITFLL